MTSGFAHISGIPLRGSGWLSTGYMLTQSDLETWLTQLCRALRPLHESKQLYGAMSPDHVMLDPHGTLHLDARYASSVTSRAISGGLHDTASPGFAAFEQYVDDPAWPLGPWTDIYGMSALARNLILKQSPPDAVQRMVSDTCEPLQDMDLPAYTAPFLAAIDRGLSLLGQQRFASIDEFALALNLSLESGSGKQDDAAAAVAEPLSPVFMPTPADVSEPEQAPKKTPVRMMAFAVIALIASGAYLLLGQHADIPSTTAEPVLQAQTVPEVATTLVQEPEPSQIAETTPEVAAEMPPAQMLGAVPVTELDMQAHTAARSLLDAADQAAMEQESAPTAGIQEDVVPVDVKPAQVEPVSQKPVPEETAGATMRVGITVRPWGEVFVNGVSRGVSPPLQSLSLKPGEYRVRVVNGDLPPHEQTLTVKAGESASITHNFGAGD